MGDYKEYLDFIKENIDAIDVFEKLGFRFRTMGGATKALCPFHDDKTPSLNIYKDHYHCFACSAHGNIFDIIMKQKGYDFAGTIEWIENEFPMVLSEKPKESKGTYKKSGFELAFQTYSEMTTKEKREFTNFAKERGYDPEFLKSAEVFFAEGGKLSKKVKNNLEQEGGLLEKGLIRQRYKPIGEAQLDIEEYKDLFVKPRAIFTIRDLQGKIISFAGRSTIPEDNPKYLYPKGFEKGKTLYRLNAVREKIKNQIKKEYEETGELPVLDLYITEGVFDALRLESFGFYAMAVLGSSITGDQIKALCEVVNEIELAYGLININLFFDTDTAGLRGTQRSLKSLFVSELAKKARLNIVLNIACFQDREVVKFVKDPDEIFKKTVSIEETKTWIQSNTLDAFDFLVCTKADDEYSILSNWEASKSIEEYFLDKSKKTSMLKRVRGFISDKEWRTLLMAESIDVYESFSAKTFKKYLEITIVDDGDESKRIVAEKENISSLFAAQLNTKTYEEEFNRALIMAKNSYKAEEVPLDDYSWDRIQYCADIFYPELRDALNNHDYKLPMLAMNIPKGGGDEYRLKSLYCHEQLIMQQYVLNELLKEVIDPRYAQTIPAVRYYSMDDKPAYTTGEGYYEHYQEQSTQMQVVSFAYQINMQALGETNSNGAPIFREFYDCWKDFISYIGKGIFEIDGDIVYKVKLDLTKFYNNIQARLVREALTNSIANSFAYEQDVFKCFNMNEKTDQEKAKVIVDWILGELFGTSYIDPQSGALKKVNLIIGIPQGPDLSAYIANIVLFKMDLVVSQAIEKLNKKNMEERKKQIEIDGLESELPNRAIVARYARYVDDIAIITNNKNDMDYIIDIIREELLKMDLQLGSKTDPPEAVNKPEAYKWLLSEKGGFGSSGIFDFPEQDLEMSLRSLGSYYSIDRRDALKLLQNAATQSDKRIIEKQIRIMFKTEEIRYSDVNRFAEILLRNILKSEEFLEKGDLFELYREAWNIGIKTSQENSLFKRREVMYLSFLDGILRVISKKTPIGANLTYEKKSEIEKERNICIDVLTKSEAYLINIFKDACDAVDELKNNERIIYIKMLKFTSIVYKYYTPQSMNFSQALEKTRNLEISIERWFDEKNAYNIFECRWRIASNYKRSQWNNIDYKHMEYALTINDKDQKWLAIFDFISSKIQLVSNTSEWKNIREFVMNDEHINDCFKDIKTNLGKLKNILIWFGLKEHYSIDIGDNDAKIATNALLNLLSNDIFAEIVNDNESIRNYIFLNLKNSFKYLPVPPAVKYPGLFAIARDNTSIARADINIQDKSIDEDKFCNLIWEKFDGEFSKIEKFSTKPSENYKLLSENEDIQDENNINLIIEVFNNLSELLKNSDKTIPSKFHVLVSENNDVKLLSYPIASENYVAISNGKRSLKIEEVNQVANHLWKAGRILEDALNLDWVIENYSDSRDEEKEQKNQVLKSAFIRLTGRWQEYYFDKREYNSFVNSVNRTLILLERYNAKESNKILIAIDFSIMTNFISYRMKEKPEFGFGEAHYHLAKWSKLFLCNHYNKIGDLFLRTHFDPEKSINIPKRRVSKSYFSVAQKLYYLYEYDRDNQEDVIETELDGVLLLANALYSNSVLINLRMQALELLLSLSEIEKKLLEERELPVERFDIKDPALLTEFGTEKELIEIVKDVLRGNKYDSISRITHIGWMSIIAWLMEFGEESKKIRAIKVDKNYTELEMKWFDLAEKLTEFDAEQEQVFPLNRMRGYAHKNERQKLTNEIFGILNQLDVVNCIEVKHITSSFFDYSINYDDSISMRLDGERLDNKPSIIFTEGNIVKTGFDVERDLLNKNSMVWTQSVRGTETLGVSAISSQLAELEYKRKSSSEKVENTITIGSVELSLRKEENDEAPLTLADSAGGSGGDGGGDDDYGNNDRDEQNLKIDKPNDESAGEEDGGTDDSSKVAEKTFREIINELEQYKEKNWAKRKKRDAVLDRIALFQFEVEDTYRHPISEICNGTKVDCHGKIIIEEIEKYGGDYRSCAEIRRRALLKKVINACTDFGVEILLLPEYSVRPETVMWMRDYIEEKKTNLSIWAGTFRVAPGYGYSKDGFEKFSDMRIYDWAAVLPIIISSDTQKIKIDLSRRKKYPSVALQEQFQPSLNEPLSSVIKTKYSQLLFKTALDDMTELICAELFAISSPGGYNTFAYEMNRLYQKFEGGEPKEVDELYKIVLNDAKAFSQSIAFSQVKDKYGRTPIVLVPAFTTRAVDYYVIGQANYLSSGITTAFCNISHKQSMGGSCFIGTDSWDRHGLDKDKYMPQTTIYHGTEPGIYHQFSTVKTRGGLGKHEQALLICDINPTISFEGKPNPQSLQRPLQLVAHLPIIESTVYRTDPPKCRCERAEENALGCLDKKICEHVGEACKKNCQKSLCEIVRLHKRIQEGDQKKFVNTTKDNAPKKLGQQLIDLGEKTNSPWLKQRGSDYIEQHLNSPQHWPPPTALDWIWVDVNFEPENKDDYKIQVPRFRNAEDKQMGTKPMGEENDSPQN